MLSFKAMAVEPLAEVDSGCAFTDIYVVQYCSVQV